MRGIRDLAKQIQEELQSDKPMSLCELRFTINGKETQEYYEILGERLLKKLQVADLHLGGWAVGVVLLLLIAERARRHAKGHALWEHIAEWIPHHLRSELFCETVPTPLLKELIVKAVKHVNLRNAFGDPSIRQPYYVTVHLQFGMTRDAVENRLAGWMAGEAPPIAVRRLLSGPEASDSFRNLWQEMMHFRRGYISESQLQTVLERSRWVLPEWHGLITEVLRQPAPSGHTIVATDVATEGDRGRAEFLRSPVAMWDFREGPYFVCEWAGLRNAEDDGEFAHLDVRLGETLLGRVVRGDDGTLRLHEGTIRLSADHSPQVISLVEPDGHVVGVQTLDLFPSHPDVVVYEVRDNARLIPVQGKMSTRRPYVLWTFGDLRVLPEPTVWFRGGMEHVPWMASYIDREWDTSHLRVVTSNGEVVWSPTLASQVNAREDALADRVDVVVGGRRRVSIGERVVLTVHGVPADTRLISAQVNGRSVGVDEQGRIATQILPVDAWRGLYVELRIAQGERVIRLHRRCHVSIEGGVYQDTDGMHACGSRQILTVRQCRSRPFRLFCPDVKSPVVLEGTRFVRRVGKRPHTLPEVLATGAPLTVRPDQLNAPMELFRIADGVVDQGIVDGVEATASGWELTLAMALEPAVDHAVLCWPCRGERRPTVIGSRDIRVSSGGTRWSVSCPGCGGRSQSVVAIRFREEWLGGAIDGDWREWFEGLATPPGTPSEVAAWVRWFRLPVLLPDPKGLPVFAFFAHRFPAEVLGAWLRPAVATSRQGDAGQTEIEVPDSERLGEIIRSLFADWQPTDQALKELCAVLGTQTP